MLLSAGASRTSGTPWPRWREGYQGEPLPPWVLGLQCFGVLRQWPQGMWELSDARQRAAQDLTRCISPAGCPVTLVPSLLQGSPGVKGAIGPVGPPGASVSGPPVRVLSVLHAGVLLGPRVLLPGRGYRADPAQPHSMGDGRREAIAQPSLGEGRWHCFGEHLNNDDTDHQYFLSSECSKALC